MPTIKHRAPSGGLILSEKVQYEIGISPAGAKSTIDKRGGEWAFFVLDAQRAELAGCSTHNLMPMHYSVPYLVVSMDSTARDRVGPTRVDS